MIKAYNKQLKINAIDKNNAANRSSFSSFLAENWIARQKGRRRIAGRWVFNCSVTRGYNIVLRNCKFRRAEAGLNLKTEIVL